MGKDPSSFNGTVQLVYFCFLILIPVILVNLIIGMAVNDIQALQNEGRVRQLRKQSTFIVDIEDVLSPKSWLHQFNCCSSLMKPISDFFIHSISQSPKLVIDLNQDDDPLPSGCLERAMAIANQQMEIIPNKITNSDIYNLVMSINNRIDNLERLLLPHN